MLKNAEGHACEGQEDWQAPQVGIDIALVDALSRERSFSLCAESQALSNHT